MISDIESIEDLIVSLDYLLTDIEHNFLTEGKDNLFKDLHLTEVNEDGYSVIKLSKQQEGDVLVCLTEMENLIVVSTISEQPGLYCFLPNVHMVDETIKKECLDILTRINKDYLPNYGTVKFGFGSEVGESLSELFEGTELEEATYEDFIAMVKIQKDAESLW